MDFVECPAIQTGMRLHPCDWALQTHVVTSGKGTNCASSTSSERKPSITRYGAARSRIENQFLYEILCTARPNALSLLPWRLALCR